METARKCNEWRRVKALVTSHYFRSCGSRGTNLAELISVFKKKYFYSYD